MRIKTIIVLLLSVLPFFQMSAQNSDPTPPDKPEKVTRIYGGRAGVKIPTGYSFLEEEEAEAFANKIGDDGFNPNRIGYLVPEQDADEMISFPLIGFLDSFDVGHINYPESMETDAWKNMLMKLSDCKDESAFSFLWKPITFHDTHATSIGFSIDEKNETEMCAAVVYIPVKEGFWMWYIRFPKDYAEEAKDICALLADSISFDFILNYDNFEFEKRSKETYNYFFNYYDSDISDTATKDQESFSSGANAKASASLKFLKAKETTLCILGVLGILGLIALIFFCVILSNRAKRKDDETTEKYLTRCVRNIKARLGLFASIYAIYIVLSFSFIIALFYATVYLIVGLVNGWFVFALILGIYTLPIDIFIVICIAGIWMGAITLFITLINPIKNRKKIFKDFTATEGTCRITSNDSPALFGLIEKTAAECGVKTPESVYLSMTMNAGAMYENPFKGMRHPDSPKSLIIGLPVIYFVSTLELKAILAHEFGHFAQKSTSQLTAVWYARKIISKLLYFDKSESERYDKWLSHSNRTLRMIGRISYGFISQICLHVYNLYGTLTRASNEMSREMELDADRMSAKVAGAIPAISALSRLQFGERIYDDFNTLLKICYEQHAKMPESVLHSFKMMTPILLKRIGASPEENNLAMSCSFLENNNSRVEIINEWNTHPETELRIERLRNSESKKIEQNDSPAESLVTCQTINKAENEIVFSHLSQSFSYIPDEEFKHICLKEIEDRTFPKELAPFFNREIHLRVNNWPRIGKTMSQEEWESSSRKITEYQQALVDYTTLLAFKEGKYGSKEIKYLGKKYKKKNAPLDEHIKYIQLLKKEVEEIDMRVMAHAMACAGNTEMIKKKYMDIDYCQHSISSMHDNFDGPFEWLRNFYMSPGYVSTEESVVLSQNIRGIEQDFKAFIEKEVNFSVLSPVLNKNLYNEIVTFVKSPSSLRSVNDTSQANIMFQLYDCIEKAYKDLVYFHSKNICAVIEGKNQEICWKNSVASTTESENAKIQNQSDNA